MTKLVASDINLNKIFEIFLQTVYEKHSFLIDSYEDLNLTVEEIVKQLSKIEIEIHDEFVYQVYQNITSINFLKVRTNSFRLKRI